MSTQLAVEPTRRRFTVAEYEQMARAGVLREDDRVELLDGEIVETAPIGPPHAGVVKTLNRWLVTGVGDRGVVGVQDPVRLAPFSEPEPDLTLAKPRADGYMTSHPGPDDVLLLVEVSDSSLAVDRGVKVPLYAAAGIPEVWVVDIESGTVHVHRAPEGQSYADIRSMRRGDRIAPDAFPEVSLDVAEIFGS